jgi:hypothetical protein
MATLELEKEELSTLKEVLENDIGELRVEIIRTERWEYKDLLKHKEQILEKILAILEKFDSEKVTGTPL